MSDTTPKTYIQFDKKYRPTKLERVIGHETAVTRMQGILKTGKIPHALLLTGPSSVGKTTLARAFSAALMPEGTLAGSQDYKEMNAGVEGKVEDIREMLKVARLRPFRGKRRVILIDEAQMLTGASAQALLKPLEEPAPGTLFILCSMQPEKIMQAMKNRCTIFELKTPTKEHVIKYAKRIAKAENMAYCTEESLSTVAEYSNGEMRSCAMMMEALQQYASGLEKIPKTLTPEITATALESVQGNEEELAVRTMAAVYARKFGMVRKALLDVQDHFRFITLLLRLNSFMLSQNVMKGDSHKSIWWSGSNKEILAFWSKNCTDLIEAKKALDVFATVERNLVQIKAQSGTFLMPELEMISCGLYNAIKDIKRLSSAE